MISRISFFVFVIITLAVLTGDQPVNSQAAGKTFNGFELVDKTGNIRKPADFRDHYELLGTWTVLDPAGNQIHVTYASPGAAEYYRCASALPLIKSIAIPTLMIAAQDDPIVPFGLFSSIETDCVRLLAPRYGGHGAFISGDGRSDRFWVDAKVLNFCFDNSKYANA